MRYYQTALVNSLTLWACLTQAHATQCVVMTLNIIKQGINRIIKRGNLEASGLGDSTEAQTPTELAQSIYNDYLYVVFSSQLYRVYQAMQILYKYL